MFRYIDLFCGIGGFHQGVNRVSTEMGFDAECVFAADNDQNAANVYRNNYGIDCYHDLKLQETHDLLQLLRENGRSIISPLWPHYFDPTIDISKEPDWKQKIIRKNQEFYKNK